MVWKAGVCTILICWAAGTQPAQAEGVMTYGIGLRPCGEYVKARDEGNANAAELAFLHWLGGFFSGANNTSTHRNNALGLDGLAGAGARLER